MRLLPGRIALVTGGASGIGAALGEALARRGLEVALADLDEAELGRTVERLRGLAGSVSGHVLDVTDASAQEALVAHVERERGPIEFFVANAGVGGPLGPLWELDPADWAWTLGVNVQGVAHGLSAVLPRMIARRSGHVLVVSSLAGVAATPFLAPYAASKHAVIGLARAVEAELAVLGAPIGISVVCPGPVESRIADSERSRPPELRPRRQPAPGLLEQLRAGFEAALADPMPASRFAERVLAELEAGTDFLLTHVEGLDDVSRALARTSAALERARTRDSAGPA